MSSTLALLDCDSFFCNCERLFHPELRGRPVIVLSNNDGCAISLSKEAKALGIEMAAPFFKIRELCEKKQVAVFSSNFSLYTNISTRVMNTLKKLVPRLEIYSVDEAFLDLAHIPNPTEYARQIKAIVERHVGVPVSLGLATTKGLCKAACFLAKRDRTYQGVASLMSQEAQDQALAIMPIEKIWGIGKGRGLKLRLSGIKSAKDFRDYKNDRHIQSILTKVGRQIQDELRGIVSFPLQEIYQKKKEIMSSRTFGQAVYDKKSVAESIATHAFEVSQELRQQESVCQEVYIYIHANNLYQENQSYYQSSFWRFETPTSNSFKIIDAALRCLNKIYQSGVEYRKSGVALTGLQDASEHSLGLFEASDTPRQQNLMQVMDSINFFQGPRTLLPMACGVDNKEWRMNRKFKSPRYTSDWSELPKCM